MRRFNVFAPEFSYDDSRPNGYRAGTARLGPALGANLVSATVYELPPGESTWPYHYEYGAEEWALVLRRAADAAPSGRRGDRTRDDPLHVLAAGRRLLPRQRQDRHLANGDEPAILRREPVDYWDGESG